MRGKNKKLGRKEFDARVSRVVRSNAGFGPSARPAPGQRPFVAALVGFAWFYLILRLAKSRELIEQSLSQGQLNADLRSFILGAIALLILASIGMALYLSLRAWQRHPRRPTAGGLVTGIAAAILYCYTPASVYAFGYELLDDNTKSVLASAGSKVAKLELTDVQVVSSWIGAKPID